MPKRRRHSFTPRFKAQVVLEVLSGQRSVSESARQHKLKPELISRWRDIAPEGLDGLVEGDDHRSRDQDCITEAEADGRTPDDGAGSRKNQHGRVRVTQRVERAGPSVPCPGHEHSLRRIIAS